MSGHAAGWLFQTNSRIIYEISKYALQNGRVHSEADHMSVRKKGMNQSIAALEFFVTGLKRCHPAVLV